VPAPTIRGCAYDPDVGVDAIAELRGQIDAAVADHTLDPADRYAKLSALRSELAPLLGEIDRRRADMQKVKEAEASGQAREVLWARSNASLRETLIERGELDEAVADAMGMLSHAELDRLEEEGLLEEAIMGIARKWEEALHPRVHGRKGAGQFSKKLGTPPAGPAGRVKQVEPKTEPAPVHRLRVGDHFSHPERTGGTLEVKKRTGAGVIAQDEKGRTFDVPHHDIVGRHVDDTKDAAAEHDQKALRALADYHAVKAERAEKDVTPVLTDTVKQEGGTMDGLDYRLKSRASIISKITRMRDTKPLATDEERAASITDLIRYTAVFPSDGYNQGVERTMAALDGAGFKQTDWKNYWGGTDDYDGLHVIVEGKGGTKVELQFHTPESLDTKGQLHPLFEKFRESKDAHERWKLWEQMIEHTSKIPQPKGVEALGPALPSSSARQRVARGEDVPPPGALPENHDAYFTNLDHPDTQTVPLDQLVPTKSPESQPDSVNVAQQRMADAKAGRAEKRAPITVQKRSDGKYDIVDGNATYGAAQTHGWSSLPVQVKSSSKESARKAPSGGKGGMPSGGVRLDGGQVTAGGSAKPDVSTSDIGEAIDALAAGKTVELHQLDQVSTLLDRLHKVVSDMEAKGEKAPNFDLCKVSVRGSNIFCADHKGIPRLKMPQLKGPAQPNSKAAGMTPDASGEVDLSSHFMDHLKSQGVQVTRKSVLGSHLRASQRELNGAKVAGIMKSLEATGQKSPGHGAGPLLFVSNDNYVVDGHHRWAAQIGHDFADGVEDSPFDVDQVDMSILPLLAEANKFAASWGIPQSGVTE